MDSDVRSAMTLLAKGTDPNAHSRAGCTPLLLAAYMGHVDCLAALMDAGAMIDASNALGDTALGDAALSFSCDAPRVGPPAYHLE